MVYTFNGIEVLTLAEFKGKAGGQDYKQIKESLLPGQVWKDVTFLPNEKTLGSTASNPQLTWRRAKDVESNPVFVEANTAGEDKVSRFDIVQGRLADCWFMVSLDAISEKPELVKMVIPEDNTFDNDNSVFHFRFWRYGHWVDVVVDDMLPMFRYMDNFKVVTKLAFAGNRGKEFWIPLLEKAYAKFNGSYSMLNLGHCGDGLEDLSGGLSFEIMIRAPTSPTSEMVYGYAVDAYERGSLICLGILTQKGDQPGETKQANGLARGHAYSVTGMGQVPYNGKKLSLVRIRNPWGSDFEWNGAWSDGSKEWNVFDKEKVKSLGLKKGDGEFWMSWDDMMHNFDILSICHLAGEIVKKIAVPGASIQNWRPHIFHGIWPGAGCANNVEIAKNPQYLLDLRMSKLEETTVAIAVMNKTIRLTSKDQISDVYFPVLLKVTNPETVTDSTYEASDMETNLVLQGPPNPTMNRESFDYHKLPRGVYVIIPIFGRYIGIEGKFLLRVYTDSGSEMKELTRSKSQEK